MLAADTGSGLDAATQAAATAVTAADTGSGLDAATQVAGAHVGDTGTAADAAYVTATIPVADTWAGDDEASVAAGPSFPEIPLGLSVQMLINGTWTDVTSYVYERSDVVITRGRPDETQQVQPSQITMVLDNRDGRFSPSNPSGAYAPSFGRNVQLRVSVTAAVALPETTAGGPSGPSPSVDAPVVSLYSGYRFWGEIASIEQHWDSVRHRPVGEPDRERAAAALQPGRRHDRVCASPLLHPPVRQHGTLRLLASRGLQRRRRRSPARCPGSARWDTPEHRRSGPTRRSAGQTPSPRSTAVPGTARRSPRRPRPEPAA